eukprot:scaffold54940_cov39-Cyclotella_meneghiniana.AAC.1
MAEQMKKEAEARERAEKAREKAALKEKEEEAQKNKREKHDHVNKRNVVECSFVCTQEEENLRYNELPSNIRLLLKNMQKVDKMVCLEPVIPGDAEKLWEPTSVPYDHTDLGDYIVQSGGVKAFEMKKPRKNNKKKGETNDDEDEEELVLPEVYFTLSFSCDKDPYKIMDRVAGEWGKVGGKKLYVKKIQSFTTVSVVNIFHIRTDNNFETILAEFKRALEEAKDYAESKSLEGSDIYILEDIPEMNMRTMTPKIQGQKTEQFQGWSGAQHRLRQVLTVEVDESVAEMVKFFVEIAKSKRYFQKLWGYKVKVTALSNMGGGRGNQQSVQKVDMAAMASFSRKHTNYQNITRMDGIRGILDLDKEVPYYSVSEPDKVEGTITLRKILYSEIKLSDGYNLFEELHQAHAMAPVDVVVPNIEEAERMMLMMQKNSAAFIKFFIGFRSTIPMDTVDAVLAKTMDPVLVADIEKCSWDNETMVLTTPDDEEIGKKMKMEEAAWYVDMFEDDGDDSKKKKIAFASKEALDELHCDHSFKSIHQRKGTSATLSKEESNKVGSADNPMQVEDDVSAGEKQYENLSPEELVALLKKHNITPQGTVGPPPNFERSETGTGEEANESSDSSGSSSGSSGSGSSSSSNGSSQKNTSPSSAEGNTAAPGLGRSGG